MKCTSCGVEYGKEEVNKLRKGECKKCNQPLNLVEFWSDSDIIDDLGFALTQPNSIVLVAENSEGISGFTWGYRIPISKFRFLEGKIDDRSSYMDEIAVRADKRLRGVGTRLGKEYIEAVRQQGLAEVVLRTDERNTSSIALFRKLGFSGIVDIKNPSRSIYDPQFPSRVYLRRGVE